MSVTRLFAPRTVAVVGASPTAGKAGNALMQSLREFEGAVHPVHPKASEVLGREAFPDVASLPEPVDLALLAVPAQVVPRAVAECAAAGVGGVVVHAGGFAETGQEGEALQRAATDALAGSPTRLVGPNTSGFIAPASGLCASFVSTTMSLRPGPLAIVAQSGGVNHALAFGAQAEGLGIRLAVGLGNAADVGFADVLDHLREDPEVGVVALAIEGLDDGRALVEAIERVAERVPVVALKLGRTDVSDFAKSHTGALTGSYAITRAALRQAGAVVVDDTTALLDAARALSARRLPPRARPGVGVVTGQAGPGLLLADALAAQGAELPPLDDGLQTRLGELLGGLTFVRNPVDTGRPGESFPDVLRAVAGADGIDVLAVYLLDEPDAIDLGATLAGAGTGPLVAATAGAHADVVAIRDTLARGGIPVFPTPERAATGIAAMLKDAQAAARRGAAGDGVEPTLGEPDGTVWDEHRAKGLLASLGIATPAGAVCATHDEAVAAARELGPRVVLKLLHPELTHKSDVGAVRVGLSGEEDVRGALEALDAVELPSPGRYLVEAMAPPGPELIVGAVRDRSFGPVVTLGAGGVDTEILADVTTRLAPVGVTEAGTMLGDLATGKRYRGHRGGPSVDEYALARAISALSHVLVLRPDIAEIEVNPLRVTADGLVALDALVVAR